MKSYIKIYGPPVVKAIRALENIAEQMGTTLIKDYYHPMYPRLIEKKLVSKSGYTLGDNDFFFNWAKDPSWEELESLISKIDEALTPLGCKYTIVSK